MHKGRHVKPCIKLHDSHWWMPDPFQLTRSTLSCRHFCLLVCLLTAFLLQSEFLSCTPGGCILKISEVGTNIQHIQQALYPGDPTNCRPAHANPEGLTFDIVWHLMLPIKTFKQAWPNCRRAWPYYMIFQTHSGLHLQCATELVVEHFPSRAVEFLPWKKFRSMILQCISFK